MNRLKKIYSKKYLKDVPGLADPLEQNWKTNKILPHLNKFLSFKKRGSKIKIIEVGGGTGMILRNINHLVKEKGFKTELTFFETSKLYLQLAKKNNPEIKKCVLGDISKPTSFKDKEFDLCLLVDVLEHIQNIQDAMREIGRISKFAIIKIPIERSISITLINLITFNKKREDLLKRVGHIHTLALSEIKKLINQNLGKIISYSFTNLGEYMLKIEKYKKMKFPKKFFYGLFYKLSKICYKISPRLNSIFFTDSAVILVKCY